MSVLVESSRSKNKDNILYPILARDRYWGMIVMFTSETTLIVLDPNLSDHNIGDYKENCSDFRQDTWEILPKDFVISIIQQ